MSNEKLMQRQRFYKIIRVFKQYHVLSNLSHQVNADEVCRAFEILGPTFVKIGQILATRTDMIKPTFAAGLSNLQDNAQVDDFATVKQIIETETGQKIEAMYQEFDAKPFASASMGQAHHAILKTGQKVVVKVQHPGIYREIMNDLALFAKALPWLDYVPDASVFN
ncbi:MAG: AarF/ABC1/UbiB kinase family protein, partial [Candidatus Paralactobacillus gallistercoris]|nr:AarF/ABC1/UbiB kinase family protein [Candidatus Paralactobacillus gallistercoris]